MEELRRYEGQHASSTDDANVALKNAAAIENVAGQIPAASTTFKIFGVSLGFMLLAGAGVQFALMNRSCSSEAQSSLMMFYPMVVLSVWLGIPIFLGVRRSMKKASRVVGAQQIHVACPTCGADNVLVAGSTGAGCAYCSARLVPSATAVIRVLDASATAQRVARMAEMRAKRAMTLRMRKASVNPAMMVFGSFSMLFFLGSGSFLVNSIFEGDVRSVALLSLVMSVAAAPVLLFFLWRNRRRERWALPVMDLAHQFSGHYSTRLEDQVEWLNTYWTMSYSDYWITGAGLRFGTLQANVAGYAVMVDLHPEKPYGSAAHAKDFQPRLNILLACQIPLRAQSYASLGTEARGHYDALRNAGFALQMSTSGILAEGDQSVIKHYSRKPDDLHGLSRTLQTLALLASHLAPPAAPLP